MMSFNHINAGSVKEALALMTEYEGRAVLIAGGTDLLSILKDRVLVSYPELVINIKTIPNLDSIETREKHLTIGPLARLAEVAGSRDVVNGFKVLADAAGSVATPVLRGMGTIGGNLCQDVRCWYYRYPHQVGGRMVCRRKGEGPCFALKGDNRYHAILGAKTCFAVCPSDTAIALAALEAEIWIRGRVSSRRVPVAKFFTPMGNSLKQGEMVSSIKIPRPPKGTRQVFIKFTERSPIDFATVSVASVINIKDGVCKNARIVLGGVAPVPYRAEKVEQILEGRPITREIAMESAEAALSGSKSLSGNAYKVDVAKTLVRRAILHSNQ